MTWDKRRRCEFGNAETTQKIWLCQAVGCAETRVVLRDSDGRTSLPPGWEVDDTDGLTRCPRCADEHESVAAHRAAVREFEASCRRRRGIA